MTANDTTKMTGEASGAVNIMTRKASASDAPAMADFSEAKRQQYAMYQPVFHRPAENARASQIPFIEAQIARENNICLVSETNGIVQGFVIATVHPAPPVYEPGGPVCGVDDFCVAAGDDWRTVGRELLAAVWQEAKARGAVLNLVVCGPRDEAKRAMLAELGYSVASEWHVREI